VLADAAVYGSLAALIRLPLEHPLDCVKTQWQAHPSFTNSRQVVRHIWLNGGVTRFWAGILPAAVRSSTKELYRFPLMVSLPQFYHSKMSTVYSSGALTPRDNICAKIFTAETIATLESVISCPLERCKVLLMTRGNVSASYAVLNSIGFSSMANSPKRFLFNTGMIGSRLFQGFGALYARQSLSWTTFLVADSQLKQCVRSLTGQSTVLTFPYLMFVSFGVGLIHTVVTLPVDCLKTRLQQFNTCSSSAAKWMPRPTVRQILSQYSLGSFYVGFRVRLLQYVINSIFTVALLEHLEYRASQ